MIWNDHGGLYIIDIWDIREIDMLHLCYLIDIEIIVIYESRLIYMYIYKGNKKYFIKSKIRISVLHD